MKQAIKVIEEIKRMQHAMLVTNSQYMRNDYMKKICKNKKELKEYCFYKNINYIQLTEKYDF